MPKQFDVQLSDAEYEALLRIEAFKLHTTMAALLRLSLSRLLLVRTVKPISVIQAPALVDNEDLPPKSGPTG